MTGFEPRISGVGSARSTNRATTTVLLIESTVIAFIVLTLELLNVLGGRVDVDVLGDLRTAVVELDQEVVRDVDVALRVTKDLSNRSTLGAIQ